MYKVNKLMSISVIFLIILSIGVYAAGSSTGAESENKRDDALNSDGGDTVRSDRTVGILKIPERTKIVDRIRERTQTAIDKRIERRTELKTAYADSDCEEFDDRKERIRCRLVHGEEYKSPEGNVPEACKVSGEKVGHCVALYSTLKNCYKLEGKTKDRCFKRAIGLRKASLNDENPEGRVQKARDYIVALLYDLQERVEEASEEGKIDSDDATDLIEKIVEVKQGILNGAGKAETREMMRELKEMWGEINFVEEDDE
jgi:hypothetical protein